MRAVLQRLPVAALRVVCGARGASKAGAHGMPRGVKKENLPTKVCVVCNRPFTWRKKWCANASGPDTSRRLH